jgi:hypothetical protein
MTVLSPQSLAQGQSRHSQHPPPSSGTTKKTVQIFLLGSRQTVSTESQKVFLVIEVQRVPVTLLNSTTVAGKQL